MGILFMLFCALMVYLIACAIAYPLQFLLFHGAMILKDLAILPEDLEYTKEMAMEHTEMVMGALLLAGIGYGILKFIAGFFIPIPEEKK